MTIGDEHVVLGKGFNYLPNQLVLATRDSYALNSDIPHQIIRMTSKTDTEMIFTAEENYTYQGPGYFTFLATPNTPPRTIIEYETIDNRDLGETRRAYAINDSDILPETLQRD